MVANPAAELHLSAAEFGAWSALLAERTGVVVPTERQTFLESNLRRRMRELQLASFDDYQQLVLGPRGAPEWGTLVDRLTVHQTHFFRHLPSFELIRDLVLPAVVARQQSNFHAWSVGTSTGEEAWSLAMMVDHFSAEQTSPFQFGITGSDVSRPALAKAREATYLRSNQREIPKGYRSRYCEPIDRQHFSIAKTIQRRVGFAMLNLLNIDQKPLRELDLIFCQNVLIYFPRDRRHQILDQFAQCLRPGGYLILGPGETTKWSNPTLAPVTDARTLAFCKLSGVSQEGKE